MTPELGIIDGRFGLLWSADERAAVARTLAPAGYSFYHYGPKGDAHLRRRWREPHPSAAMDELAAFADLCRGLGMRFGVALTPMDARHPVDPDTRAALVRRVRELSALGLDDLAILFDDLRGDVPGLAEAQAELVHLAAQSVPDARMFFCPTYYSTDPVLDRVFGARPPDYLPTLGRLLDPAIRIYWTGEEVCAREVRPGHLADIAGALGRKLVLWDNYPVNDGARMSRHLHLRAFTGRDPASADQLAGHAINPAIQPLLTCIPALTLPMSYARGGGYRYGAALAKAARTVAGEALGAMLEADVLTLDDTGHDRLSKQRRAALRARYAAHNHPVAREVVGWLDGIGHMSDAEVQTQ